MLLPASSLLQVQSVREACCKFLLRQLHPSNCLGIRSFAGMFFFSLILLCLLLLIELIYVLPPGTLNNVYVEGIGYMVYIIRITWRAGLLAQWLVICFRKGNCSKQIFW